MPCPHSLMTALFAYLFACCSYSGSGNVGTRSLRSGGRIHWDTRVLLYVSDNDVASSKSCAAMFCIDRSWHSAILEKTLVCSCGCSLCGTRVVAIRSAHEGAPIADGGVHDLCQCTGCTVAAHSNISAGLSYRPLARLGHALASAEVGLSLRLHCFF